MGTAATGGASHRLRAVRPVHSSNGRAVGGGRPAKINSDTGAIASGKNANTRTQRCSHAIPQRNHSLNGHSNTDADADSHAYAATHAHTAICSHIYACAHTHTCAAAYPHGYADPHTHANGYSSTLSDSCHHRGHHEH